MSFKSFIGGEYQETTGGNSKVFAGDNIEYNSGGSINSISDVGNSFNTPKDPPHPEIKNEIKGLAIFRRPSNYLNKPNFGFDWYAGENYKTSYSE
ncbi:hypothetical protein HNQ02_003637 [Flavobacterium sp. 7E]|uniref:hypothetical protein n=1 Tax=Flavobacterium sp. 7E TaxID=2735898 RepID=UPI00156F5105|nr:hypothetical protein [Flavobacterium sp. 7E]NRS90690.1 hypothetical protein [Flavobacterium sp. 7E]